MKMYQVVWERHSERLATWSLHAGSFADAVSRVEAILAEHPELDFDRAGAAVRVRVITFPLDPEEDY